MLVGRQLQNGLPSMQAFLGHWSAAFHPLRFAIRPNPTTMKNNVHLFARNGLIPHGMPRVPLASIIRFGQITLATRFIPMERALLVM